MRAVDKIKRFWAGFKIKRRIQVLKAIADFVAEIKSDTLVLDQNLYLNIAAISSRSLLESRISYVIASS